MKKFLLMVVVAMMTTIGIQAQRIEVVDADGHGIPLVSVLTEDGNLDTDHWEWNGGKGRMKMIIETYATERGYMDKQEWNAKKKELKQNYKSMMTLDQLEAYATAHGIPALAPTMIRAINAMQNNK